MNHNKKNFGIAIHGGASPIAPITLNKQNEIREALKQSLNEGYKVLEQEGSAIDAVEAAVKVLEDSYFFNAGKGAAFTEKGENELHAAIMCGATCDSGAVSTVKNIKNPITLAKFVLRESSNIFLCGKGAKSFALSKNVAIEPDSYFFTEHQHASWQKVINKKSKGSGTVGAVALDKFGNLAAGTSTGGLNDAACQRISDSAIIGAGTFADNHTCAISCTGDGEYFIRTVFSHYVSDLMELKGLSLKDAILLAVERKLKKFKADLGVIGIDKNGVIELFLDAEKMYRGCKSADGTFFVKIFPHE